MSLPSIDVAKAFLERYIALRQKTWKIESYKDITDKSFDLNPKLTTVALCLNDIEEMAKAKDQTSSGWIFLLFKLQNHFKNERVNSGFSGYFYDPKTCDHLRYMMSYICNTLCDDPEIFVDLEKVKQVLETQQKSEQAAGKSTKETEERIAHINSLAKNFHLYKADPAAKCEECFQLTLHIERFDSYRNRDKDNDESRKENTFDKFVEFFSEYNDEESKFIFCDTIAEKFKIHQKEKQKKEVKSESKEPTKPAPSSSVAIKKSLTDYVKEKEVEPRSPSSKEIPSPISDASSSERESSIPVIIVPPKPVYVAKNRNTNWQPQKKQPTQSYANAANKKSNPIKVTRKFS